MSKVTFCDLRTAAYCPRKLYYRRRDEDRGPPESAARVRELAFRYERLLDAPDDRLAATAIEVPPERFRERLAPARDLDAWPDLVDPPERAVLLTGRDCRGIAHKILSDPPRPSLVSAGRPPDTGVWAAQSVHAVAAAKALAYERERPVASAFVEYPAYGAVRRVRLTTRRKAAYRRVLRTVRSLDGPPPRIDDRAKCRACEYADQCGVRTRSLRSLLGL